MQVSGGRIQGSGILNISAGALLTLTGSPSLDGWTINNYGSMTINSASLSLSGASTLSNYGDCEFTPTTLALAGGSRMDNYGTMTVGGPGGMLWENRGGEQGVFVNHGGALFRCQGSLSLSGDYYWPQLNNDGEVRVEAGGYVGWFTNGQSDGQFVVHGQLDLAGGVLGSGSQVTGEGVVRLGWSWLTVAGRYAVTGSTYLESGNVDFTGQVQSVGGTLCVEGSTVNFHGNDLTTRDFTCLGYDTTLTCGDLTVAHQWKWNGGTLSGSGPTNLLSGGVAEISSGVLDNRTLNIAGRLTMTGLITLVNGSALGNYDVPIGGTTPETDFNQLLVNGNVLLKGTLQLQLVNDFWPTLGTQFTIIQNTGAEPIQGTFAGLPEGAILHAGGCYFQITYKGGPGQNSVVLTTVSPWGLPDLAIDSYDITFSPIHPDPGQPVTLAAAVTNQGPAEATDIKVSFFTFNQYLGDAIIPSIPAGGSGRAELTWTFPEDSFQLIRPRSIRTMPSPRWTRPITRPPWCSRSAGPAMPEPPSWSPIRPRPPTRDSRPAWGRTPTTCLTTTRP